MPTNNTTTQEQPQQSSSPTPEQLQQQADNDLIRRIAEQRGVPMKEPDFGNGRYSTAMKELYQDSQRLLGLSPEHAKKLAEVFGSDLGRYAPKIEFKFGRKSKDGKITIRELSKMKDLTITNSISLMRAVQLLQEATGWGVNSYKGVTLDAQFIEWLKK